MKTKTTLLLILISLSLLFSGCFSDWKGDTGTITLNFDNNSQSSAALFPPVENPDPDTSDYREVLFDEIEYEIIFSGHNEEFTLKSKGKESVLAVVTPGRWEITVKAYIYETDTTVPERIMYAIGKETVRVKPGYRQAVTVKMTNKASVNVYIGYDGGLNSYEVLKEYISYDIKYKNNNSDDDELNTGILQGTGPHRIEIPSGETYFGVDVYLNGTELGYGYIESIRINPGDNDVTISWTLFDENHGQPYLIFFGNSDKGEAEAYFERDGYYYRTTYAIEGEDVFIKPIAYENFTFDFDEFESNIIIAPSLASGPESPYEIINIDSDTKIKFKMPSDNITITLIFSDKL
jgi:hypothetical protein